jgi:hypothetical protein
VISEDYSDISLIVSGLRFVNTSGVASGPVIQAVAGTYLAQYTYDVPRTYENVTFYESSLAFSPATAGTASTITLGLDLTEGVLRPDYSLVMNLPDFICSSVTTSTGTVSWDSTSEQMTVALSSYYLASDARTTVVISGCTLPSNGIATAFLTADFGYSVLYATADDDTSDGTGAAV